MENPYLTTKEVADLLKVTEDTITSYIKRKNDPLPAIRPGRAYLILRSELDEWLKRQKPKD